MIVVSGEALMDVFDAGHTPTGLSLDARIGGSPLNVAIGLARLGQPVRFFAAVSTGFLGERLMQAMRDEGVLTDCVARVAAPTTLSLVGLDAQGGADYAFYGHGAADRQLATSPLDALPAACAFQFGSYAMVVDPIAITLRGLVSRETLRSVIAYDVNVRLNVQPDLGRWREVVDWMVPRTHLLKLSDEDLRRLYPGEQADALAAQWVAAGVAMVVLTRGGEGATAWHASGRIDVAGVPVQVIDTVGAGDTFQAALLAGLRERGRLNVAALRSLSAAQVTEVLRFAAQAAAITCSRRGADLPRRHEVS